MKITKKQARRVRIKLEAVRLGLQAVTRDNFLKESAFKELEGILEWVEDVERIFKKDLTEGEL